MGVLDTLLNYLADTGFGQFHWTNGVMLLVGALFVYLAIAKKFEPLLLLPIGFGILIGNVPYDASKLPLGVHDGPVSEHDLRYYLTDAGDIDASLTEQGFVTASFTPIEESIEGQVAVRRGEAIVVNTHSILSPRGKVTAPGIYSAGAGRAVVALEVTDEGRYPELWSLDRQNVHNASIFWWLFAGVGLAGFYPPLIFLGIGALTDFGPMLSNPKTILLGAAAQFGIFASLLGAIAIGFDINEAASIGIIGGADGPTAIFTASQLAPHLLGAVALAAYSYMAMVPIIQPPIIKLLTSKAERRIRMTEGKPVSRRARILFPIVAFLITAFIAPGGLPLLGMLFLGNLLRESLVADRLVKTAQNAFIDIVTILLGVTVGAKTSAATFLTWETIGVFLLGIAAFCIATATGVLFAKLLNRFTKEPINPMIGAAGVSAVPMAARVVHKLGQEEDPQNFLLMHAMGPNVAGVIGSAVAAGVLLSQLGGN
ncbi:MAG: sodium ion-translocating decarboxylase subunit beta [Planctomycetota bacterium]